MNGEAEQSPTQLGSEGERRAQHVFGTSRRALVFYQNQMRPDINLLMQEFIARQEMMFIATADAKGECDCSFRAGPAGFVQILDSKRLAYPEYRGNGVMASVGNILENPQIGLIFLDFTQSTVGLHINGRASVVTVEEVLAMPDLPYPMLQASHVKGGRHPECWVMVEIEEAYIHCSKHVPRMTKVDKQLHWGTDDEYDKGGNFFQVQPI